MLGECCLPLGTGDDACSVKGSRFFRGPFCVLTELEIPMISSSVKALRERPDCFVEHLREFFLRRLLLFLRFCGTFSGAFSPANVQNH